MPEVEVISAELQERLEATPWSAPRRVAPATEVAAFALSISGKRRQARRSGRFGRLIARFALAACLALASVASACQKPDASADDAAEMVSSLPSVSAAEAAITQSQPRASPAWFSDLLLVDAGSDSQPWAVFVQRGDSSDVPILMDRQGAAANQVGTVYRVAAQPVKVGTRDGVSQFLDPLVAAESSGSADPGQGKAAISRWQEDERYLAVTRAVAGKPSVLDAAYNAEAAASAGGTHTYSDGVVLRVEPDKPVIEVIDRTLLQSAKPTRAEDLVYVAIRPQEQSLYSPGQVVNLRDVVMEAQKTDVNGQLTNLYVANAALDGARVEPTGATVDLQNLLAPRLQRVDQDLAAQAQASPAQTQTTATPGATPAVVQQPVIVQQRGGGSSFIPDFLLFMWLTNGGFYSRGPTVIVNNPPPSPYRTGDVYYSAPPPPSSSSPSTVQSAQADARNTALQASRSAVSGQAAGTGGGVAATNKAAADASARASAVTSKAASVAGGVSSASSGKSISSAPASSSSTASRSAGSVSAGSRGSLGSSSSGSSSIGRSSSGSSGGFGGGKGIGSSGSS